MRCEGHVEDVVGVDLIGARALAVAHREHVVAVGDDALGEQEALGEFDIRARGAHRDGDRFPVDPDLQWLLDDQSVGSRDGVARGDMLYSAPGRDPSH